MFSRAHLRSAIALVSLLAVSLVLLHNMRSSRSWEIGGLHNAAVFLSRFLLMSCASLVVLIDLKNSGASLAAYIVVAFSLSLWIPTFISL